MKYHHPNSVHYCQPVVLTLFLFLAITIVTSCTKSNYQYIASETTQPTNTFLFVSYRIYVDSTNKNKVDILELKQVEGTLKHIHPDYNPNTYIVVQQLEKSGKVVSELKDTHPLYKRVEFVDQHNAFTRKDIVLKEAEFFIRMPLYANTYTLHVYEVLNNNKKLLNETVIPH